MVVEEVDHSSGGGGGRIHGYTFSGLCAGPILKYIERTLTNSRAIISSRFGTFTAKQQIHIHTQSHAHINSTLQPHTCTQHTQQTRTNTHAHTHFLHTHNTEHTTHAHRHTYTQHTTNTHTNTHAHTHFLHTHNTEHTTHAHRHTYTQYTQQTRAQHMHTCTHTQHNTLEFILHLQCCLLPSGHAQSTLPTRHSAPSLEEKLHNSPCSSKLMK